MKKQIYFPKGAKSINFDLEQGIATAVYEEERPALNVGEWYRYKDNYALVMDEMLHSVGFENRVWCDLDDSFLSDNGKDWQPADMQEVKKLLIKEAEKRGFKGRMSAGKDQHGFGFYVWLNGTEVIFSASNGKWAEIVKKPFYVNQYGTEFFEGDVIYSILKLNNSILKSDLSDPVYDSITSKELEEDHVGSEPLTERECHRYLYENWDNLNK